MNITIISSGASPMRVGRIMQAAQRTVMMIGVHNPTRRGGATGALVDSAPIGASETDSCDMTEPSKKEYGRTSAATDDMQSLHRTKTGNAAGAPASEFSSPTAS